MTNWYIEGGGKYTIKDKKIFGRNIFINPKDIDILRDKFDNTDVFSTIYQYCDQNMDTSKIYAPLYFDMDIDLSNELQWKKIKRDLSFVLTAIENELKIPRDRVQLFFSGNKGFHLLISPLIFGIQPIVNLNEFYKFIALKIQSYTLFNTIDTKIYDRKRLFRLPNSINGKTNRYKVPVSYDYIKKSSHKDMLLYASSKKEYININTSEITNAIEAMKVLWTDFNNNNKPKNKTNKNFKMIYNNSELLPCIKAILEEGVTQGNRNNTAVIVASALLQNGKSKEEVQEIMLQWNEEKNSPQLPRQEILSVISSAIKRLSEGKSFGCTKIKEYGWCKPNTCHIAKRS